MPSGTENGGAPEEIEFAGERGDVRTEQDRCEPSRRRELHLIPCDLKQYLNLRHWVKDQYDLFDGIQVWRVCMVEDDEHTQVIFGLYRLLGRVSTDERRVTGLSRPSVKLQLIDAAVSTGRSTESSGSSSSSSERCTEWRGKKKKRGRPGQRELGRDGSGKEGCREPDVRTATAETSESSDFDSLKERSARLVSSSKHSPTAVVEVTSRPA